MIPEDSMTTEQVIEYWSHTVSCPDCQETCNGDDGNPCKRCGGTGRIERGY